MAKLVFDAQGQHYFENGVDHGVLYVASATPGSWEAGVAWNGLTAVTESPEGAEETALYADNIKYLALRSAENFKATIEAYTYPDEFEVCDGCAELVTGKGVKIGQQSRKAFCFAYRTNVGSDANPELGYKLHIIYNASAAPSERAYATVNDSPEAMTMSWEVSTTPVPVTGLKPTAHLEIDSRQCPSAKLALIAAALYGTSEQSEITAVAAIITGFAGDPMVLLPDQVAAILNAE